jgi:RNA polymerase sigma-70 factor, ECF subfamily
MHRLGVVEEYGASEGAIEQAYRLHFTRFLRLGYALLGSRDLARDAVQETFATALRRRESFRGEGSIEGWLWTTMLNVCRQEQRRRSRLTDQEPPEQSTNGHPQHSTELRALIAALPEQERNAVFLRYYADLSQDEIADVLGVRPGTVGAALNHARNKLRYGLTPEVTR